MCLDFLEFSLEVMVLPKTRHLRQLQKLQALHLQGNRLQGPEVVLLIGDIFRGIANQ